MKITAKIPWISLVALALFLILPGNVRADTHLIASGTWNIPSIWDNGVPVSGVRAFIDNSFTVNAPTGLSGTASNLYVGYSGSGTLKINGGSITNFSCNLGSSPGSAGTATVSSGTWTNSANLYVGNGGTGILNVSGGIITSATDDTLGNIGNLCVGYSGTGTLNINGGTVANSHGYLANGAGSNGTATISSGTWVNSANLNIGVYGTGTLNLSGSGAVTIAGGTGTLTIAGVAGSTGVLNIGMGDLAGTLSASSIIAGSGMATVNFNHLGSYAFAPKLTGNLGVNKLGAGTTILTGSHTYTGPTTISGGTLELDGYLASGVSINSTGRLTGNGTINQNLTIDSGGVAQFSGGTFTVNGNIVNNGLMILSNGAKLAGASASFVNNGTIDIITGGAFTPPSGFQNNGLIVDSSAVKAKFAAKSGSTVTITVNSHTGHNYQLQYSPSLSGGSFTNVGLPQTGSTGSTLTFTDTSATGSCGFYRVMVLP